MKQFLAIVMCFALCVSFNFSSAQILDRIKNKVKQRGDQKVDETVDKGLDKAEGKNKKENNGTEENSGTEEVKTKSESKGLKSYSKYDFVPGDKIVYAEDFSQDVIGEFPLKWNTNGSGEVVTLEGLPGKWLKITEGTKYESPYKNKLPENYTVEFDLLVEFKDAVAVPYIKLQLESDKLQADPLPQVVEVSIAPHGGINVDGSNDGIFFESRNGKGYPITEGKKQLFSTFYDYNHKNTPVHIALWVQKQRIRVWINQDKMYDLPKGLAENMDLKKLAFETTSYGGSPTAYDYYISNIKIATAAADTRNKLITEGSWSTTGILFDVNSDKIKPVSYGTLKEIATILSDNTDVKVKIIGHTDADGDDAKNLELSKKRAASVKEALSKEFNIDASRLETDGMGETKPIGDNKTAEGKAQNRRVEFVKL
ncbi:MAG TPA: OmpA family protein [Chitinophagaceae bacterium]|nr:OmpA family protein [Chitinophagaceae bacterium]